MNDLLPILFTGALTGLVTWGGIRVELHYMRTNLATMQAAMSDVMQRVSRMEGANQL